MADVSHNTQTLLDMAEQLKGMDIDAKVTDKVRDLEITGWVWPEFSKLIGTADNYEQLRQAAEDASGGLDTVVTAVGGSVQSVANYYKRMEEQQGTDFDSADLDAAVDG